MSNLTVRGNVSGTGTVIVESPNTNSNRTITLPDVTGTLLANTSAVIQPRGIPLFSAFQSTAQTIGNTYTKVNFQSEEVDTNNWFDTTLSRYTPQISGWYQFSGNVNVGTSATTVTGGIFKNGAFAKQGSNVATNAGNGMAVALIYMNGTTDFAEFHAIFGVSQIVAASSQTAFFQGYLVRAD